MGDIVYWDGGEYLAPKAVASADVVAKSINENTTTTYTLQASNWRMNGSNYAYPWGVSSTYSKKLKVQGIYYADWASYAGKTIIYQPYSAPESLYGYVSVALVDKSGGLYYFLFAQTFPSSAPWSIDDFNFFIGLDQVLDGYRSSSTTPSTNNPAPTYLEEIVCAIAITYTDTTTYEIPLSYCPPWVKIRSDSECPDGTCRIDCGDHYCCYDCSGKPVLTIPKED